MKNLIVVLTVVLMVSGCAGLLDIGQPPLNITAEEIEAFCK